MKTSMNIIMLSFVLLLSSCTSAFLLYENLAHIHKDMTTQELKNVLENDDFGYGVELINDDMEKDMYTNNSIKYLVTERRAYGESSYYIFLFQDDKLVYWGFPYQIANHSKSEISGASPDISKTVKEKYID